MTDQVPLSQATPALDVAIDTNRRAATASRVLRRIRSVDGVVAVGLFVMLLISVTATDIVAPYDPYKVELGQRLLPPSSEHLMGTDQFGRDLFSRIVHGTRFSLLMGFAVVATASIVGIILGGIAGFVGGLVDEAIMRVTDLAMGFPALLFAMLIAAVLGANLLNAILAAAVVWWPSYVRLMRSQVLAVKSEVYVEAARSIGATNRRIIFGHILPNSWSPLMVRGTMDVGRAVIFVGALSFVGLGAAPPQPEWGTMLAEARDFIVGAWWYVTFPGLAILATVLCFSLLGDLAEEFLRPSRSGD